MLAIGVLAGSTACGSSSQSATDADTDTNSASNAEIVAGDDAGSETPAADGAQTDGTQTDGDDSGQADSNSSSSTNGGDGDSAGQGTADGPLVGFEEVLMPTWLPDGWQEHSRRPIGTQLSISYGEIDGDETPLTLSIGPVDDRTLNLEAIYERDLTEGTWLDVRGGTDNGVLVTSFEDGSDTIAFIEGDLLYQVISEDNALPDQGRRFVEALEVPPPPPPPAAEPADPAITLEPADPADSGQKVDPNLPTESPGGPGNIDN